MISLAAYMAHGLAELLSSLSVSAPLPNHSDALVLVTLELADTEAARQALSRFHDRRWPTVASGRGATTQDRMADLGELLGALYVTFGVYKSAEIFPRCLSASGRRVSQPGIDVTAFHVEPRLDEPLQDNETLHFLEAKHSTSADATITEVRAFGRQR